MGKMMVSLCASGARNYIHKPARRRLSQDKRRKKRAVRRADRQAIKAGREPSERYALTSLDVS